MTIPSVQVNGHWCGVTDLKESGSTTLLGLTGSGKRADKHGPHWAGRPAEEMSVAPVGWRYIGLNVYKLVD